MVATAVSVRNLCSTESFYVLQTSSSPSRTPISRSLIKPQRTVSLSSSSSSSSSSSHGFIFVQTKNQRRRTARRTSRRFAHTVSVLKGSGNIDQSSNERSFLSHDEEDDDAKSTKLADYNIKIEGEGDGSRFPKRIAFDYGFQAKFLRKGPTVPGNVVKLAFENYRREWRALRRSYLFRELEEININKIDGGTIGIISAYLGRGIVLLLRGFDKLLQLYDGLPELKEKKQIMDEEVDELQKSLKKLTLTNDAVWEREKSRPAVEAPWWILGPYYALCLMLDVIFKERPIQRFWFLETVARMPYFSYISMLHLYETLGWWRVGAEVRKVHFAEEWNEMHHLKIMESLGGDLEWGDRFFAQHAAFFYYWILNLMFLISPKVAYNFSELIEFHAVDTYSQFVDENEELLKSLPPPPVAVDYYESEDLYMYDEFQTSRLPETRRPKINSLYDVFNAIAGDEYEHVKTMVACQQLDSLVVSPHNPKTRGEKLRP